jgi:hypothetical protein
MTFPLSYKPIMQKKQKQKRGEICEIIKFQSFHDNLIVLGMFNSLRGFTLACKCINTNLFKHLICKKEFRMHLLYLHILNFDIVFGREKHVVNDSTSNELVHFLVNLCKELNFGVIFGTPHPYHKKISLD